MPDVSKLSKFLKPENVQDGDTITFVDAGVIVERSFKEDEPKKPVLEITVKFKDEDKTYSPNKTTVKLLSAAWGTGTEGWVGKKAVLSVIPSNNGKDMIIGKPFGASAKDQIRARNQANDTEGSEETVPF